MPEASENILKPMRRPRHHSSLLGFAPSFSVRGSSHSIRSMARIARGNRVLPSNAPFHSLFQNPIGFSFSVRLATIIELDQ